jgi:hypothetical protein
MGLVGSGRSTIFEALTRTNGSDSRKVEDRIASVKVPDKRVDDLVAMYKPAKITYAKVEYLLPAFTAGAERKEGSDAFNYVRNCDALLHIVRNFSAGDGPAPREDFLKLERELIFSDFMGVDKRLERLNSDKAKNKKFDEQELELLTECHKVLEKDAPLRTRPELANAPKLRGYTFMSAKPVLVLFNNDDSDATAPSLDGCFPAGLCEVVRGKLEAELASMQDEGNELQAGFGISQSAMDRIIQKSYELLGLVSFFTVGEDEVRAWTVRKDSLAPDAAEAIHSDIKKGFIRAEVVSYDHLIRCGSEQEAKRKGLYRLEGKTYIVQDGDIISFRFNV